MRVHSESAVPRLDLAHARRLVPALWAEWHALTFDERGYLRDPDDPTRSFAVLHLAQGRHRTPGARYDIAPEGKVVGTFTFAADDGGALRGTLAGGVWSAEVELGTGWHATGQVDVRALLERNDVPGWAIGLIGSGEAAGEVRADPSLLDHRGDVLAGQGRAQRLAVAVTVNVTARRDEWLTRITARVHGRGLLGRLALLVGRPTVAKGIREALAEFWPDTARELSSLRAELADLDDRIRTAGGPQPWLHGELWRAVRETRPPVPSAPADAAAGADSGPGKRGFARRYSRPVIVMPARSTRLILDELKVTERPDRVTAQVGVATRAGSPARFRGRLEQQTDRTVLVGAIRESATNAWMPRLYGSVTILLTAIGALGVVQTARNGFGQGGAPLLIGLIGGLLFVLLTRLFAGSRRQDFVKESDDLADALGAWLLERGAPGPSRSLAQ